MLPPICKQLALLARKVMVREGESASGCQPSVIGIRRSGSLVMARCNVPIGFLSIAWACGQD